MEKKKLFISHAHKDKPLVKKLVNLLDTGCRLSRDEIFCTAIEDVGIESGKDFISVIKNEIQSTTFSIILLSRNYYDSIFCLCELGAAWGLGIPIFPIIVPPMAISDIKDG